MVSANVTHTDPDDTPATKPDVAPPTRTLVLTARASRLLEIAIERLTVSPDPDAIAAAVEDLRSAHNLVQAVAR